MTTPVKPVTIRTLAAMKEKGERIAMLTAYDATFAAMLDHAGADMLLVGDSLGMVFAGADSTLEVTVEDIAYHTKAVRRGAKRAHVVADMPFLSYHTGADDAVRAAGKLMRAGAQSVKLEGGTAVAPVVERLVAAGIPVMGHVGLLPQSVHAQGGFRVQGRDADSKARILEDAKALERAGVYAMVLEGIPPDVAAEITAAVSVPTIGIGAGVNCDGQVLVIYDLLGFNPNFKPKFVKRFGNGFSMVTEACGSYVADVKSGAFPDAEHTFKPYGG